MVFKNRLNESKAMNRPFVTIECEPRDKTNLDYADLVSPLNEKQVCSSLDFFSMKAPKKKPNLKKVAVDDLKSKRKRLENYFSTVDLDNWSESNFVLPNTKSENWHDDLHYIVLKQQERSNFIHQLWFFFVLILFCIMLISIAGLIYSNNSVQRSVDEKNSYEFMQKFINEFNHTKHHKRPNPINKYFYNPFGSNDDESNENWSHKNGKHFSMFISNIEDQVLNLTKKAIHYGKPSLIDAKFRTNKSLNEVNYDLLADKSSISQKIDEKFDNSSQNMANKTNSRKLSGVQDMFKYFIYQLSFF